MTTTKTVTTTGRPPKQSPTAKMKTSRRAKNAAAAEPGAESESTGAPELAGILSDGQRLVLFAGAEGGEGAGGIAFSAARQAAREKVRCIVVDIGRVPSEALGYERPGLCDLLGGTAAFGEVIQRDDTARVHLIPYGDSAKRRRCSACSSSSPRSPIPTTR